MKTSTYLILFLFALSNQLCIAQMEQMVVAKPAVFIRDSTTVNSKSLCSIKFGEMVQIMYEAKIEDTVDGMKGTWVKVKYNTCTGYIFDSYLGNFIKQDKKFPKNYPQYFKLDGITQCIPNSAQC